MNRARSIASAIIVSAMIASLPHAAAAKMPGDVAKKVRDMGPVINPPATAKIYMPLQEMEPYKGVKVTRDVKYGDAERNVLDVFEPEDDGTGRPVLIFVHGGAFVAGNKHTPGTPFYDNISVMAAHNGIVGVNMTYRLAPASQWPAGPEDVAKAVKWVKDNIAQHGGDPAKIYLMGHSAGAVHVASYAAFPRFHPDGNELAGLLLISGLYDFTKMIPPGKPEMAYFGDKAGKAEISSFEGLLKLDIPVLLVNAELDPPPFIAQKGLLEKALCDAGKCPAAVTLDGHSHISEVYAINTDDDSLSGPILDFIKK